MNAIFVKGVHKETEEGLAWIENSSPKHRVSVLLYTGSSTNLISARCFTKMSLGKPLPPTEAIMDFGGRKIKTLGLVDLNIQVGGIEKEIWCNETPDLRDLCMVLCRETCKDQGFIKLFFRSKDGQG